MNINVQVLDKINEKVDVIIWFQGQPLSEKLPIFPTMNYLLDGLLKDHLKSIQNPDQCTFVHQHFGKKLQVLFLGSNVGKINLSHLQESEKEFGLLINCSSEEFKGKKEFDKVMKWVDEIKF